MYFMMAHKPSIYTHDIRSIEQLSMIKVNSDETVFKLLDIVGILNAWPMTESLDKISTQLSGLGGGTAAGGPKKGTIMEHEGKTYRWEGKGRGGVGPQWSARSEGAGATGKFLTGGKEGARLVAEGGGNKALTALFEEQLGEGAMFGMDPDFYGGGPTSQLKATQIHSPEAEYRSEWMQELPTANTWLEKIFHVLDTSSIATS